MEQQAYTPLFLRLERKWGNSASPFDNGIMPIVVKTLFVAALQQIG